MINKKVIDTIYKKYSRRPASPDELDVPLLFEKVPEAAMVEVDGNSILINSIDSQSPFHSIPVVNIHAILDFEEAVAIVLHSSIIFLSKHDGSMNVHLRALGMSFIERIKSAISG